MTRRCHTILRAATALTVAVGLAACNNNATPGPVDSVRSAAATFLHNCAEGQGVAASEGLTEATREDFLAAGDVLAGCRLVLGVGDTAVSSADQLRSARVAEADEHGGVGSAVLELPGGLRRRVEAEQVEGRWLLALPPLQP